MQVHPSLSGVGYGSTVVATLVGCYYNVIIAWCLFYLGSSMQVNFGKFEIPNIPQNNCCAVRHKEWNFSLDFSIEPRLSCFLKEFLKNTSSKACWIPSKSLQKLYKMGQLNSIKVDVQDFSIDNDLTENHLCTNIL